MTKGKPGTVRTTIIHDYFNPPHGGRAPSDEAVAKTTARYVMQEKLGLLNDLPVVSPTHR